MRISICRLIPGQTRFGIFQNRFPREWPDLWYFAIHAGFFHIDITGN